jgi:hypothetical protein
LPRTRRRRGSTSPRAAGWPPTICSPTSWSGSSATKTVAPIASRSRRMAGHCMHRSSAPRNGSSPTR